MVVTKCLHFNLQFWGSWNRQILHHLLFKGESTSFYCQDTGWCPLQEQRFEVNLFSLPWRLMTEGALACTRLCSLNKPSTLQLNAKEVNKSNYNQCISQGTQIGLSWFIAPSLIFLSSDFITHPLLSFILLQKFSHMSIRVQKLYLI